MALFVVRHQHAAESCPAQDPYMGAMLLNHLSRPNARRHGVKIQGEAVVQGEHTLYFIAEADDEDACGSSCSRSSWRAAWTSTRPRRAPASSPAAAAGHRCR